MIVGVRAMRDELTLETLDSIHGASFNHVEWDWKWDGVGTSPAPASAELETARDRGLSYGLSLSVAGPTGLSVAERVQPLRDVSIRLWQEIYTASFELNALWLALELGSTGCPTSDLATKRQRIGIGDAWHFSEAIGH